MKDIMMRSQGTASSCESSDGTKISSHADPNPCINVAQEEAVGPSDQAWTEKDSISMLICAWTEIHLYLNFCLNMLPNVCSPQWQVVMLLLCVESFLCSCFVISSNCNKRCLS